jgi:hypothetical protein
MAAAGLSIVESSTTETAMSKALVTLAAIAGFAALFAGPAAADPYKWCAQYGGRDGGATNCGFVSLAQCQATISGMGGFCAINQFYTGPADRPVRRARRHNSG